MTQRKGQNYVQIRPALHEPAGFEALTGRQALLEQHVAEPGLHGVQRIRLAVERDRLPCPFTGQAEVAPGPDVAAAGRLAIGREDTA